VLSFVLLAKLNTPWVMLPVTTFFDLGQSVEALYNEFWFLSLFTLQNDKAYKGNADSSTVPSTRKNNY
jgi:hypothetical protein